MGKKPVVAIVGLIWAGMALVGCESCKNCRQKYNPTPTYPAKAGAPGVPDAAVPPPGTPTAGVSGAVSKSETSKVADAPGTKGFGAETPASLPVSTNAAPSSPMTQNALRPSDETRSLGLPGQSPEYRSGETLSRSAPTEGSMRMPPRPVTPVVGNTPGAVTETLPPIAPPSSLPPPPNSLAITPPSSLPPPPSALPSSLPLPPMAPMIPSVPGPANSVNNLPGIDPLSK